MPLDDPLHIEPHMRLARSDQEEVPSPRTASYSPADMFRALDTGVVGALTNPVAERGCDFAAFDLARDLDVSAAFRTSGTSAAGAADRPGGRAWMKTKNRATARFAAEHDRSRPRRAACPTAS